MVKEIPLTQGKIALIDDADFESIRQFKWRAIRTGHNWYAVRTNPANGSHIFMHRSVLNPAPGLMIDHINGDGLDNRRTNIRLATNAQNQYNRRTYNKSSGFKGVCWDTSHKSWVVRIDVNGHRINLGRFHDPEQAACVYDEAARTYFGEFARTNF